MAAGAVSAEGRYGCLAQGGVGERRGVCLEMQEV